jgi:diguanylate cyclase (GGDEF)-like protein/PAS domain S-box-containing protein
VVLGAVTWKHRSLPGAIPFIFIAAIATLWSAFNALEMVTQGLEGKLLWNDLQYVSITLMPVAWLIMALDYAGKRSWMRPLPVGGLLLVPLTTIVLLWTNQYHHLMRMSAWLDTSGAHAVLGRTLGWWFWVHTAYSYSAVIAAVLLLALTAYRVPRHYRGQPLMLLTGLAFPVIWNVVYVLFPGVLPRHDFTPATFTVAGIIVIWGLLRFRLFSLVPVARHVLVEGMRDGLLVVDEDDRVVDLNESARRLIGISAARIYGRSLADTWGAWPQLAPAYNAGASRAAISLTHAGTRHDFEVEMSRLTDRDQVIGRLLVLHDVTERSRMEESLRVQALTDALTGLPNRTLFMTKLDDAVRQARRNPSQVFAVVVLDLDRFKPVNDSIGHLAGDALLCSVAERLTKCVRDVDVVARMGGDEFMILLHGVTSAMDVVPVVERIQSELKLPLRVHNQEIISSASIGVAVWEDKSPGPEELLRAADTAMYQAKEAGGGCCRIFDEQMHESVMRALRAEVALRSGINRDEFTLAYQPILDLRTGAVHSIEALMRWRRRDYGTILPGEFIKLAENCGLIVPLGELALEEVCSQLSRWRAPGSPAAGLPVRLNVSPKQLTESDFAQTVLACMDDWRVDPESIILELTETALIRDPLRSKQVMMILREGGLGLCLDDFGTGWSSLGHLTTFPVQHLKIDRSFVGKITQGNTEFEIVRAIIELAHSIGLEVTGEGVEQGEQLALLDELACDHVQGYYVGRPMSPDALVTYLEDLGRGSCPLDSSRQEVVGEPTLAFPEEPGEAILAPTKNRFAPEGLA